MATKFAELINNETPTLVDFYAEWCGPCKAMKPILEDLKKKIGSEATIIKLDVDKNPLVAQAYHIRGVPTLILFKKGKILWKQSGVIAANDLYNIIKSH